MTEETSAHTIADRILGIAVVVLAIAYGYGAQQFEEPFGLAEVIGSETFPTILSIILGLSGLTLIVKPQQGQIWPKGKTWLELIVIVIALIAFALLLEEAGFILSSIAFCWFVSFMMGAQPLRALVISVSYSVALYVLFNYGLELALPAGWLGAIL
ncbi:tripartite tricarboxylate transporter TctB family protein [Suttonella sp. R2A3]|uniref:tripartite tricarboxylate transporter TctB family protein n=1 Tax=Suttonella sp. R2A3 TaxID=2908648 RepID=UPI001F1699D4|nr:tripartite tricarboxylate transporter TctB family protein [Suttonella sp. R2A3]UJF24758.1 tripartite tricarboxylate transporter TctB family protein [Suttonella sp. R2A3]